MCGLASILVPYPHATNDHQTANARELERAGAAELLPDAELRPDDLADRIARLVDDAPRRARMAAAAAAWARPNAGAELALLVSEVAA